MGKVRNLLQVGPKWYVRKQIPADLRHGFGGKVEIRRSLRTGEKREAERRLHKALADIDAEFAKLRREQSEEAKEARAYVAQVAGNLEDYELAARASGSDRIAAATNAVLSLEAFPSDPADFERIIQERINKALAGEREMPAVEAVKEAIELVRITRDGYERNGITLASIDHDGEPVAPFPLYLIPEVEAFIVRLLKQEEDKLGALLAKLTGAAPQPSGRSLWGIYESWQLERSPASRTKLEFETAIKRFEAINGPLELLDIQLEHGTRFREALFKDSLKSATVRKQISCIKNLLNLAANLGRIQSNPLARMNVQKGKDKADRDDFTPDDFAKLFAGIDHGSEKYWIMRLAQYTGARASEICQLTAADVIKVDGVHCLSVNTEGEKLLKTQGSKRIVPIHKALIDEGFLEFVPAGGRLFPSIKPDAAGRPGGLLSKWFTRYRRKVGIASKSKVFHSFRHTFITAARQVMPAEFYTQLTGHAGGGPVYQQYGKRFIPTLKEYTDKVSF